MASTRNKNMPNEYRIQQDLNKRIMNENLYINSQYGKPLNDYIPLLGYMPSHMSRETFSNNSIDIESSLYGIGSSNLVNPKDPVVPDNKLLFFKPWFYKSEQIIMPQPLVFKKERPSLY